MSSVPSQKKSKPIVTLLGDSTIDNKVWVWPGPFWNYIEDHAGIKRDDSETRIKKSERLFFKPELTVVENLMKMLPLYQICDYTNDGFTTSDVIRGNVKDKTFGAGQGTFKLYPNEFFAPLKTATDVIKQSDLVILSVGGNNFREFLLGAFNKKNSEERKSYIKNNFYDMLTKLQKEYIEIVEKIRALNSSAQIILMTQYYPSVNQKDYNIYSFMKEIGEVLNIGRNSKDPMDVIHEIMKQIYLDILNKIPQKNIVVADITSSLNPYDKQNYTHQIEPSGPGGYKIAQMLKYVILNGNVSGLVYQFRPDFFIKQTDNEVEKFPFDEWCPKHPNLFR